MAKLLKAGLTPKNVGNDFLVAKKRPRAKEEILGRASASMSLTQRTAVVVHGRRTSRLGGVGKRGRETKMYRFWLE